MLIIPVYEKFNWERIHRLLGLPYQDPRLQALFVEARITPDRIWREHRVGIYSMPPHDQMPCPMAEIDLEPSFRVRLRFKHASLVEGELTNTATTFVLAAVTYFLEVEKDLKPFPGQLPFNILATDKLEGIVSHVGRSPSSTHFVDGEELGYAIWEDRNPVLHVLYNSKEDCLVRVNVFLSQKVR